MGGEVTRVEQALKYEQERRAAVTQDLEQTRAGLQEARGHLNADVDRLAEWQSELATLQPHLGNQRDHADQATGQATAAEAAMTEWQAGWEAFNQAAAGPRQESEVQQSRIVYLEKVLNRLR